MKFTNTQPGPRGINTVNGPILVDPKETVEVEVYAREQQHIEATQWFEVKGSYTDNPGAPSAPSAKAAASGETDEIKGLRKQLADREAELAKLKANAKQDEEPPKTAAEVLAMASNPEVQFMTFKAAATKLLGDKTPAKKDEIVAALEELATQP
ncbi:hypothetical protein [Rhizobium sp. 2MFCol3.1]|uniref:hypothetical protein n=1 Tax=Rhizobium sp. 2MFCol3.1 TaxID=1246459 RepID=UPI00036407F5|nr:hypothetical protein [Rhizobium sp. 2MFCol3.1]